LVGGLKYGWNLNADAALVILVIITFGYGLICLYTSQDFQLLVAKVCTLVFSLLMSAAFIGLMIQLVQSPKGESTTPKPGTVRLRSDWALVPVRGVDRIGRL
jgi:chitin synthase